VAFRSCSDLASASPMVSGIGGLQGHLRPLMQLTTRLYENTRQTSHALPVHNAPGQSERTAAQLELSLNTLDLIYISKLGKIIADLDLSQNTLDCELPYDEMYTNRT
jgi:hypothetical protein